MSETGSLDDAEVSEPKEELFEHVTDAYIRYTDVMFHWHKSLNPWHVSSGRMRTVQLLMAEFFLLFYLKSSILAEECCHGSTQSEGSG